MKLLLSAIIFLQSCIALAYPETIRGQYQSCSDCHISPTGGGVVSNYGRVAGEDFASFTQDKAGGILYGMIPLPDQVAFGGDSRYVDIRTKGGGRRAFVMQNDFELAVKLSPEVWIDATYGLYGPDHKKEYRRNYVLWQPRDFLSLRVGRFIPGYGLNLPDHTTSTRSGLDLGEGTETYNVELGVHNDYGELLLTSISGDGTTVDLKSPGYTATQQQPGVAARLAVNVGKSAVLGASYMVREDPISPELIGGPFVMWGITRQLYVLSEADRRTRGELHTDVEYTEIGYEVLRGLHLQLTHEYEAANVPGVGIQWYPIPHVELLARAKYIGTEWVGILMAHFNW